MGPALTSSYAITRDGDHSTMSDEPLKILEKYLRDVDDLDAQFDRGELTRVHWLLKKGHLTTCLQEAAPRVHVALQYGQVVLLHWSSFTREQRELSELLQKEDLTTWRIWRNDYLRRNMLWAAKTILALYDGIELPPIPTPGEETPEVRPSQTGQFE